MGCASSRTESRNVDLDDYNTLDVAFVGGDGRPMDEEVCPVDKIFLNYSIERSNLGDGYSKEPEEILFVNKNVEMNDQNEM